MFITCDSRSDDNQWRTEKGVEAEGAVTKQKTHAPECDRKALFDYALKNAHLQKHKEMIS